LIEEKPTTLRPEQKRKNEKVKKTTGVASTQKKK